MLKAALWSQLSASFRPDRAANGRWPHHSYLCYSSQVTRLPSLSIRSARFKDDQSHGRATLNTGLDPHSRPFKFERRKALIVRAAIDVINRKGVRGMTHAEIASQLSLVPTAVNYYFRRKEDLAAECYLQSITHYDRLLDRAALEDTAEASLQTFLRGVAEHLAEADRGEVEPVAIFNDVRTIGDKAVNAAYANMFRRIRRIFKRSTIGGISRLERNARTHLLLSQVTWAVLWLRQYNPADYSRMIDRLFDVLINGLMGSNTEWAPSELPRSVDFMETTGQAGEDFLRGGNRNDQRKRISWRISGADFRPAQRHQRIVLPSQWRKGRPSRAMLSPHPGDHACRSGSGWGLLQQWIRQLSLTCGIHGAA